MPKGSKTVNGIREFDNQISTTNIIVKTRTNDWQARKQNSNERKGLMQPGKRTVRIRGGVENISAQHELYVQVSVGL